MTAISSYDLTDLTTTQSGTTLTAKEDKGGYEVTLSEILSGITVVNGVPTGITGVDFGEKTATTVAEGDTISIGNEKFMVLTNDESTIMAMPYYNITKSTTNPVQASSGTGTVAFSGSQFWTGTDHNIEPMSSSNIQQYISAYSTKLSNATKGKVIAEAGRYYGVHALSDFFGKSSSDGKALLNPSGTAKFWLGSSAPSGEPWFSSEDAVECLKSRIM